MIQWISNMLVPLLVSYIVGFGLLSKRPVFDDFLAGAKEGMRMVAGILPTLIGLMTAVGVMRASGFLDAVSGYLSGPASWLHLPAPLIPLTLVRLVSNSAATGLALDIFARYGPDSFLGMAASVMMSSTETVFYCISIYFGSVHVTKTRYVLPGALFATAAGIAASIYMAFFTK
ncbi:MAG: spore maturation protein [Lachnospiraceae bacterium]|jgi:spore maturation protein B|nr:spore maturation protein [Lachnospiraceae bacterium]